jgi:hypothetical protein
MGKTGLLLAIALLIASGILGCGSTTSSGTATSSHARFLWEGPANLHPRWEAAEVLVKEAEELHDKFKRLRPGNFRGRLAVLAQLEHLDLSCEIGYGVLACRRRPALLKITREMNEALVPKSRRHIGLSMSLQVAVARYRLALRNRESLRATAAGTRAFFIAVRNHGQCKGIPTCPYQRSGHIAARLDREIFAHP